MIDTPTLLMIGIVTRSAFLLALLATALSRPREYCLWHWIAALVTSTLGLAMVAHSVPESYAWLYNIVNYAFICAAFLFIWSGLRVFYRRVVPWRRALLLVLPLLLYAALTAVGIPQRFALALPFFACTLYSLLCIRELICTPDRRFLAQYVLGVAYGLYCLAFLLPAILMPLGLMSPEITVSSRLAIFADQVCCIMMYFGYIALTSERASQELKHLSETDPLTGLANRRGARLALQSRHDASGRWRASSVMLGDLDHFKALNDSLGHQAGDRVLQLFAERLKQWLRSDDIAVRWGGEEFLVVLPNTDLEEAMARAERLRRYVASTSFTFEQHCLDVTLSLGVATCAPEDRDFEAAILRADSALYDAKKAGRNRVGHSSGESCRKTAGI